MPAYVLSGARESARIGLCKFGVAKLGIQSSIQGRMSIDRSFIPADFLATHASEGPQIMISWSDPTESSATPFLYQLRRGAFAHPRTLSEGILISSGTSSGDKIISDRNSIVAEHAYYYTLFVKDPTQAESPEFEAPWFTHELLRDDALAFTTGYWGNRFFELLPNIYQTMDTRPDLGGEYEQRYLKTETASSSGGKNSQVFHFNEDQAERFGQLRRFLKLLGIPFDEVRRLVSRHRFDLDPSTATDRLLTFLGSNYGWTANEELPLRNRRREVAGAVPFYLMKGNGPNLATQAANSGDLGSANVFEVRDSVLLTTGPDKEFGSHHIANDPIGLPTNNTSLGDDSVVSSQTSAPNVLGSRSHGLLFHGRSDNDPGYIAFQYGEDTPDTRAYTLFPGEFTIEFWLRCNQWPLIDTSVLDLTSALESITPIVTLFSTDVGGTTRDTLNAQVALRTRRSTSGALHREIIIRSGLSASPTVILVESESHGRFKPGANVHVALSREILGGTLWSPENLSTRWRLFIDGQSVATSDTTSGDLHQGSIKEAIASATITIATGTVDNLGAGDVISLPSIGGTIVKCTLGAVGSTTTSSEVTNSSATVSVVEAQVADIGAGDSIRLVSTNGTTVDCSFGLGGSTNNVTTSSPTTGNVVARTEAPAVFPDTAAAATDALKITGGTVYHNDAFTVLVPEAAGGLAGDVTITVLARTSMGSTPSANQIHWYLDPANDAAKIANLKSAINGTADTSKVKFGSGITSGTTVGIKGLTASNGVASVESYASLTADDGGTAGNDIALTDTVGSVLVNESALASGKLAGGLDGTLAHSTNLATQIATAINSNVYFTATSSSKDITITQATPGASGDTAITLTQTAPDGLTKTDFVRHVTAETYASSMDNTLQATAQAVSIATAINTSSDFTATNAANVVTVNQVAAGPAGDTVVTITELGATGMAKTDFTGGEQSNADAIVVGPPTSGEVNESDFVVDELRVWRIDRDTSTTSEDYAGPALTSPVFLPDYAKTVDSFRPNLVLHARFNDSQSPVPNRSGDQYQTNVVLDTSSVAGHGDYARPGSVSPTISHGTAPSYVAPVLPDPHVKLNLYDEIRRRSRLVGVREGYVTGTTHHLRRARLRALVNRRQSYGDAEA